MAAPGLLPLPVDRDGSATSAAPAQASVLVIDDDPAMGTMLGLVGQERGFTVEVASDGVEGLRRVEHADFDLVVLDLNLPGMPGLEVCRRIRGGGIEVPIVVVSASSDVVDVVVGLEVGADDYVTKPFELRELSARVGAHLRRRRETAVQRHRGRLTFPGLSIDVGRHEVLREGTPVQLTRTEFDLLALLAGQPGRVVSRAQMIQQIWGQDVELDTRSIDAHIYRLRRKIEPRADQPSYIHAVPGIGYRFDHRAVVGG